MVALLLALLALVARVRRSVMTGLAFADASLLVSLLVVQVLRLLDEQFGGYFVVLANVILLGLVRATTRYQRRLGRHEVRGRGAAR